MEPGESNPNGWTYETLLIYLTGQVQELRRYHDQSVEAQARAVDLALRATTEAINKAERQTERRLDSMVGAISRDEYLAAHQALVDRVDQMQARIDKTEGKAAGISNLWMVLVAGISTLGVIITSVILITGR